MARRSTGNAMKGIAEWLASIGLSEYAQRFADNAIDLSVIRDLTEQDLKDLGVLLERFAAPFERLEGGHDVLRAPDFEGDDFETDLAGRCLNLAHLQRGERIVDVAHDRQAPETGNDLAQELDPLAGKLVRLDRQAGDISARPRQAGDEMVRDRVTRCREHDRDD